MTQAFPERQQIDLSDPDQLAEALSDLRTDEAWSTFSNGEDGDRMISVEEQLQRLALARAAVHGWVFSPEGFAQYKAAAVSYDGSGFANLAEKYLVERLRGI